MSVALCYTHESNDGHTRGKMTTDLSTRNTTTAQPHRYTSPIRDLHLSTLSSNCLGGVRSKEVISDAQPFHFGFSSVLTGPGPGTGSDQYPALTGGRIRVRSVGDGGIWIVDPTPPPHGSYPDIVTDAANTALKKKATLSKN